MKKGICVLGMFLFLFSVCFAGNAHGSGYKGCLKFKGGYSTLGMGDVNDDMNDDVQLLRSAGASMSSPDEINGNFTFGGELSFAVSPLIFISCSGGYISAKTDSSYSDLDGSVDIEKKVKSFDILANILFYPEIPGAKIRFYFGGGVGISFASNVQTLNIIVYDYPSLNVDGEGKYSGSGLIGNIRSGVEIPFDPSSPAFIFLDAGYKFGNVGHLKGDRILNGATIATNQEAVNNAGVAVDFDFSGFSINGGIGLQF